MRLRLLRYVRLRLTLRTISEPHFKTEWHGWHACRRGLGSNLNRLGVSDVVIQRILRHANVSTTMAFYVKSSSDDVRRAMTKLENSIPKSELDTIWTPKPESSRRM